jgi:hypothetical protein
VSVGLPHQNGTGWLHPPTGTVLVERGDVTAHGTAVATVLLATVAEINDDHLVWCQDCGQRYDPAADDDCPWCQGVDDAV